MNKYRIYEIAREKNLSSSDLISICSALGIEVKSHSSSIDEKQLDKLNKYFDKQASAKLSERPEKPVDKDKKKRDDKTGSSKKISTAKEKPLQKEGEKEALKKQPERVEKAVAKKTESPKAAEAKKTVKEVEKKQEPGVFVEKKADFGRKSETWKDTKKDNIRSVIFKELEKEEKRGIPYKRPIKKEKKEEIPKGEKTAKDKETLVKPKKRPEIKKVIEIPVGGTLKELSEKINISSAEIMRVLLEMGEDVSLNQTLDNDLIEIIANEYNFKYNIIGHEDALDELYKDDEKDLRPRPPIVTVMGHVDHGKTTLLDTIRKSSVASGEAGGITQHIGAYQIDYKGKKITFIDTPGHEAFTTMRARGAKVTDIAIIVVAANDGIMPQTVEAINHAKDAGVTIIIAINKIDLPEADSQKVKQGLTEYDLVPEEWGGDTIITEISAKNNINIDEVLEMILLVAELNDIKGNPDAEGMGVIIESRLDKGMGPIGSVVVKRGSINVGDFFITGNNYGKIRAIQDDKGNRIKRAEISQPVEILGFTSVPQAGEKLFIVKNEKVAKDLINKKAYASNMAMITDSKRHISLEDLSNLAKIEEAKKLSIILKADVNGSLDAVEQSLRKIEKEAIRLDIVHKGVGAITDSDVLLAAASDSIIVGFGVTPTPKAKILAKEEKIEIRTYNIIYKLIDDIELAFKGMLEPVMEESNKGKAEVREVFKMPKLGIIAGCYILEGEVERNNLVRVVRDGEMVFDGKIGSLHRFKEDVKKVAAGYECGIRIENFQDLEKGDMLEIYEIKEVGS
jgi:translation initiation factor IF-2